MTEKQKELHEWNWNVVFDDFCEHLKHGALTHESWFRNQQQKSREGTLSDDKNGKLTTVLRQGWEHDHITALRNTIRCGDIGIMQNPDVYIGFAETVNNLGTDEGALSQ